VQVALARTIETRGEVRQAVAVYTEAVRLDPTRADAWSRLAILSDKEGDFAESEKYHARALELQPQNADFYCNRGYSLYLQERWAEAEVALKRAITLNPDHRRARNNLGLVQARTGQAPAALASFQAAGCARAEAHTNLAYGLTLCGDWSGARTQYELALRHAPNSEGARKGLVTVQAMETAGVSKAPAVVQAGGGPNAGAGVVPAGRAVGSPK
jgi:Tfp pilus assembly protein PilF